MSGFEENLEVIGELFDGDYSWTCFRVWFDPAAGLTYFAEDSGCSCYGPYEGWCLDDTEILNADSWPEFQERVEQFGKSYGLEPEAVKLLATVSPYVPFNTVEPVGGTKSGK